MSPPPLSPPVEAPTTSEAPAEPVVREDAAPGQRHGVRYYSLHRERGIRPDPMPEAQTAAAEETLVTLEAPVGPSLSEADRLAAGMEHLRLLQDLPPERLAELVEALR